jgi:hypothetical protein
MAAHNPTYGDKVVQYGTVNQPAAGTVVVRDSGQGSGLRYPMFHLTFTLTGASIPVTDAAGSGSHGPLKLFDFNEGGIVFLGCRQDYTAFAEGAALTGAAGDAAFKIGVGTAIIAAAADGALATANKDIGGEISVTLSGGTGTGTLHTASSVIKDGTTTAADLNLNWSGTAATIDANSTITVTGTITVLGCFLGDD